MPRKTPEALPPHDVKAEAALLGSMLLAGEYPDWQRDLVRSVRSAAFFQPDHATIHCGCQALIEKGTPVDAVTLRAFLKEKGRHEEVGGDGMLATLVQSSPSYAHGAHYAKIVNELFQRRQAIAEAEALQRTVREAATPELAAEAVQRTLERLGEIARGGDSPNRWTSEVAWLDAPPAEARMLVQGMLREGELMVIAAAPKARKSQLAIQLVLSVVTGRPFLGELPIVSPGAVLYLNYELARATFENRASAVGRAMGVKDGELQGLWHTWHMREDPLDAVAAAERIEREKIQGLRLIVIDPLRNAYPAQIGGESFSENSNAHVAALVRRLMQLATRTGASVLVNHHTTKGEAGGKSLTDQGAGAGSLSGGVDAHYSLIPHQEHTEAAPVHVFNGVNRSMAAFSPLVIASTWPLHTVRPELDPADVKGRRKSKAERRPFEEQKAPAAAWTVERFIAEVFGRDSLTQDQAVMAGMEKGCKMHLAKSLFKAARDSGKLESLLKVKNSSQRFKVSK